MAEAQGEKVPSLAEQYLLPEKDEKPAEVKEAEPVKAVTEEVTEKTKESSDSVAEVASAAVEAISNTTASNDSTENTEQVAAGDATPASDESKGTNEEENSSTAEATEETPEIKLETAPADFRFPTTNQTRHCFTRYIEYHRCVAVKGEDAQECQKFAKYYRALCLVNGSISGTNNGRMAPSQALWRPGSPCCNILESEFPRFSATT